MVLVVIDFRPIQVTALLTVIYVAFLAALLDVHHVVPAAPEHESPHVGLNQTQAWSDLQTLSQHFHPLNSRRNEIIREWLVDRARASVEANNASLSIIPGETHLTQHASSDVVIFDDLLSNTTFVDKWRNQPWSCYIESQNVIIYIRGTDDEHGDWWNRPYAHKRGILVNAHYDSVSTGYGATDDGCGVITILQLISHFTSPNNKPRRGFVFLLNNGEEDGLYGAHAFSQHPISSFPAMFLNLEGAGAGGRATLFRSTDAEITTLYAQTPHPFGTVISADGFKRGLVRSGTDYSVFTEDLHIRGLDVAFMAPRSRYHTNQDTAKETSKDSLWHMLATAYSTTHAMLELTDEKWQQLVSPELRDGVWFDVFGAAFAVLTMTTFSILCITSLVVGPMLIGFTIAYLVYIGKWYPCTINAEASSSVNNVAQPNQRHIRGLTRAPIALVVSVLLLLGIADLLFANNTYIVYRSPYVVWTVFLTVFLLVSWSILRVADHVRPTELSRWHAIFLIYIISWVALVLATYGAIASAVGSGYFVLVYNVSALLALLISTSEFAVLPKRQGLKDDTVDEDETVRRARDATEHTPLLAPAEQSRSIGAQSSAPAGVTERHGHTASFLLNGGQPDLDLKLPSWTWITQAILLIPTNLTLVGQVCLFITSALHQTPADGNDPHTIYLLMACCSVVLLLPAYPFLHKLRSFVPAMLSIVLIGSLLWIFSAYPFDREARLKYYFKQEVNLKTGSNTVSLTALAPYLQTIISEMPSAGGQSLNCTAPGNGLRAGLSTCSWQGLDPEVVMGRKHAKHDSHRFSHWVEYNISTINATSASFELRGQQTKNCRITFDTPIRSLSIQDAAVDSRHESVAEHGSTQVRLFSRDWNKLFQVNVSWHGHMVASGRTGRVGCMWAEAEAVPALQELKTFEPVWSAVTKNDDGLVEGWYDWRI